MTSFRRQRPTISLTAASRPATGSVLSALDEEARKYEAQKEVFWTIAQSVDSVVTSFDGHRKQIATEATAYAIQALRKLTKTETGSTAARSWPTIAASASVDAPAAMQAPIRPQAPCPAQSGLLTQPKEGLRIFCPHPGRGFGSRLKE
ncbi:hypothetical protein ColTof4_02954 [Colletotrichum tofieldiae]|nr:hypothetical protein ColTof4_02954 [Colletotrichum tofieldiae]